MWAESCEWHKPFPPHVALSWCVIIATETLTKAACLPCQQSRDRHFLPHSADEESRGHRLKKCGQGHSTTESQSKSKKKKKFSFYPGAGRYSKSSQMSSLPFARTRLKKLLIIAIHLEASARAAYKRTEEGALHMLIGGVEAEEQKNYLGTPTCTCR